MSELHWVHEPARKPSDEQDAIYAEVIEKHPGFLVAIYDGAEPDADATAAEPDGRTRYRNAPMICVRVVGDHDFTSHPLGDEHRARFPRACAAWDRQKTAARTTPVSLLPGITAAELAELRDLKLTTCEALADAEVPHNLQPWREMAVRLRTLSKPRMRLVGGELRAA